MVNESMRNKIITLLLQDSIRELFVKYDCHTATTRDFLEITKKLSSELLTSINAIYERYPATDTEN